VDCTNSLLLVLNYIAVINMSISYSLGIYVVVFDDVVISVI
jgi:hypothetical protein